MTVIEQFIVLMHIQDVIQFVSSDSCLGITDLSFTKLYVRCTFLHKVTFNILHQVLRTYSVTGHFS